MHLSLGFSTCPNDTFMFDALVQQRIDTQGLSFSPVLHDIEVLNQKAVKGELDVTKISFNAYSHVSDTYQLLTAGSALGKNNGPLLIAKEPFSLSQLANKRIAIPGKLTTANLLFSIAYPQAQDKAEYLFSDIERAVLAGEVDAGLVIHETRFTYQTRGLCKLLDLGQYWDQAFGLPLPLGAIAIKRDLPQSVKQAFNQVLCNSVSHAFDKPDDAMPYITAHAQELASKVVKSHIALYVNQYSVQLGNQGKQSIRFLYEKAQRLGLIPALNPDLFVA